MLKGYYIIVFIILVYVSNLLNLVLFVLLCFILFVMLGFWQSSTVCKYCIL